MFRTCFRALALTIPSWLTYILHRDLYLTGAFIIQKLGKGSTDGWLLDILSSIFLALLAFRPWLGHDSLDENKIYIELTGVSQFFSHQNHILNSDEIFYSH